MREETDEGADGWTRTFIYTHHWRQVDDYV